MLDHETKCRLLNFIPRVEFSEVIKGSVQLLFCFAVVIVYKGVLEPWVLKSLLSCDSFLWLTLEHSGYKILRFIRDLVPYSSI